MPDSCYSFVRGDSTAAQDTSLHALKPRGPRGLLFLAALEHGKAVDSVAKVKLTELSM
jgi:hypothetical protein